MNCQRASLAKSWWLGAAVVLLGLPTQAQAHTTIPGMGDFIGGLLHPVTSAAQLLLLLGLGLKLGQHPPLKLLRPATVFGITAAVGLAFTITGWIPSVSPWTLTGTALVLGALVAWEKPIPPLVCLSLCTVVALMLGLDSTVENRTGPTVAKTLTGSWIGLMVLLCDIAIYSVCLTKKTWTRIGIRIVGSWIVAISLLILAFALRHRPGPSTAFRDHPARSRVQ